MGCIACNQEATGSRCTWCGVAVAPGGYRVEQVLAQGPYGRVYRARDAQGQVVALKELQFAAVPEAKQIEAFEREASTLRGLSHPAIPRFVAHFAEGEGVGLRLYLASTFVEGESLAARIARGPLDEAELRSVAGQVLGVLSYLHGQSPPLLHRDLKPQNLIVGPGGALSVVDFGSARQLSAGSRTHGSTLVGTFGYMPPEQLGGTVDLSSDLYALGATLLHAATGTPPSELLGPELELQVPARVPASLRPVLSRLVERRVDRRYPSAAAVVEALAGRAPEAVRPVISRGVRAVALVGLAAAGVGLAAASMALQSSGGRAETTFVGPHYEPPGPSGDAAKDWFARAKPSCNPVEVAEYLLRNQPPQTWDGFGYAAGCFTLAGKVQDARGQIYRAQPNDRWRAAGLVFDLGHYIADRGDDVAAAPIMELVLEFWPNHYQAMYHAGMSDYSLGKTESARKRLEEFLTLYAQEDNFRRNAQEVLAKIKRGEGANGSHPGAH